MQFSLLLSTLLTVTISTVLALPTGTGNLNNTRLAQLRVYGAPGCSELNLGELGIYGDYLNQCGTFGDDTIQSVSFEAHVAGYSVQLFNDNACSSSPYNMTVGQCLSGDDSGYASYKLVSN
ncbi:uncharacterized protein BO97DRAFT_406718 [Aspergillus homomorphus CBS 101889]|uniref:Uncharacterized protein n=1 Tax=Aspergillus homomorphus (strain CBS 101889) TaxID=1450537 RepID=A0A395HWU5_ASPHC|nr:hypothetical protein BO97DRAFT_406718 [Aspergillus homomorphus CBS 101889]RAL10714.1 hypothetical protein BO97DRAFT_406718 [Aspergillus homomorphus CBS 101889]